MDTLCRTALALSLCAAGVGCRLEFDPLRQQRACGNEGLVTRKVAVGLPGTLGCAGSIRCIVAAQSWIFFATERALLAVSVGDGRAQTVAFTVDRPGVDWTVRALAASGDRIFVIATDAQPRAATPGERFPLLVSSFSVDPARVPAEADSREVLEVEDTTVVQAFAAPEGRAFLELSQRATTVSHPLTEAAALRFDPPSNAPDGGWATPAVAASGNRLLRSASGGWALLRAPGQAGADLYAVKENVRQTNESFVDATHAWGPDGTVLSTYPVLGNDRVVSMRLAWLFDDGADLGASTDRRVELHRYEPPADKRSLGRPFGLAAWVSSDRAVGLVPDPSDFDRARAFVVTRRTQPPSLVPGLEVNLPFPVGRLAPVGDGFATYVVGLRGGTEAEVWVLGSRCDE